jgi:hypothetical protein
VAGYSQTWGTTLLRRLGAPVTPDNLRFLDAWSRAEGGRARNNPFNTTQNMPGATSMNSVGVKNYTSPAQGLDATYKTLTNGRYAPILTSLRAGRPATETARAVAATPWGTGSGVSRVLGDKGPSKPAPSTPARTTSQPINGTGTVQQTDASSPGLLPFPNPLDALIGAGQNAAGAAISATVKPVLTFLLYGAMTLLGLSGMTLGLVLLALSTKAGKDAAELATVAAAPEAAPAVAQEHAARTSSSSSSSSGPAPRDPETGLTPAQAATAQHREKTRQDRLQLADAARTERLAREKRARAERTRVRTARERERERDRGAAVINRNLGVIGYTNAAGSERPKPRRTAGEPLPDTPPW